MLNTMRWSPRSLAANAVGAAPLTFCANLMTAAQRHSEDQAAHSTMSHTGSNGSTMVQRAEAAGYRGWTSLAENVAAGYWQKEEATAEAFVDLGAGI